MNKKLEFSKDYTINWCNQTMSKLEKTLDYLTKSYADFVKKRDLHQKRIERFKRRFKGSDKMDRQLFELKFEKRLSFPQIFAEPVYLIGENLLETKKLSNYSKKGILDDPKKAVKQPSNYYNKLLYVTVTEEASDNTMSVTDVIDLLERQIKYLKTFLSNFERDEVIIYKQPKITLFVEQEATEVVTNNNVAKKSVSTVKKPQIQKKHSYMTLAHLEAKEVNMRNNNNTQYRSVIDEISSYHDEIKEYQQGYVDIKYVKPTKEMKAIRDNSLLSKWIYRGYGIK